MICPLPERWLQFLAHAGQAVCGHAATAGLIVAVVLDGNDCEVVTRSLISAPPPSRAGAALGTLASSKLGWLRKENPILPQCPKQVSIITDAAASQLMLSQAGTRFDADVVLRRVRQWPTSSAPDFPTILLICVIPSAPRSSGDRTARRVPTQTWGCHHVCSRLNLSCSSDHYC